eukprot:TRINITY_DN5333_c0_g1_i4.p6 TRINITY_DN5333_c0_g1~~TRINITY_DN5333_c0_g1_i4.p6  ORF type:complete len:101 (-),score=14.58 TRINITY_DN5333_c0_g1_i4:1311-1613(-)
MVQSQMLLQFPTQALIGGFTLQSVYALLDSRRTCRLLSGYLFGRRFCLLWLMLALWLVIFFCEAFMFLSDAQLEFETGLDFVCRENLQWGHCSGALVLRM